MLWQLHVGNVLFSLMPVVSRKISLLTIRKYFCNTQFEAGFFDQFYNLMAQKVNRVSTILHICKIVCIGELERWIVIGVHAYALQMYIYLKIWKNIKICFREKMLYFNNGRHKNNYICFAIFVAVSIFIWCLITVKNDF